MIAWVYGSGFPKSLDVSNAIDNAMAGGNYERTPKGDPVTDAARRWHGWGTALKPALEPITLARKPLQGTVAANVLAHGTGALNIDGCRVPAPDEIKIVSGKGTLGGASDGWDRPWKRNPEAVAARE